MKAVQTAEPPRVDGALDDPIWREAPVAQAFVQKTPKEGAQPSERTRVRVVYDKQALYIAVECEQLGSPVVSRLSPRDQLVESDWVSVSLDSRADGKTAFEMTVNAAGALADGLHYDDTEFTPDWDESWEAKTRRTPTGWTAEYRVPLRVLRYSTSSQKDWGLQIRRYISRRQEVVEWAPIPKSTAGEVSHYGHLTNLRGLEAPARLELRPFVLGRVRHRDPAAGITASGTDFKFGAGLDLKWHATQELTLDAAVLPDFAQVEADQLYLNLQNVETFYPEKRPFFLEGKDLFATPWMMVHTRRIGAAQAAPALRLQAPYLESLVDNPEPAEIYGAAKLTGQVGGGWTVGLLSALAAPVSTQVQSADGARSSRTVAPLTGYEVVRLRRSLGSNAQVGFLGTAVTRAENTGSYPLAAPDSGNKLCPGGEVVAPGARCFHDAYAGGFDALWRSSSGAYAMRGQIVGTAISDGPARMLRDGTLVGPGALGGAAHVYAAKEGGRHWVGDMQLNLASRKFDLNDLGYSERQNFRELRAGVGYRTLKPWGPTLETQTRVESYSRSSWSGLDLGKGGQIGTRWKLKSFWSVSGGFHARPPRSDDREVGDGTALQRAGLVGMDIGVSSDPRGTLSARVSGLAERTSEGYNLQAEAGLSLHAIPKLHLELAPQVFRTSGEPRYVGAGQQSGQMLFGDLDARSFSTTLRATYAVTPRLSLQSYAQLYLAAGNYDSIASAVGIPGRTIKLKNLTPAPYPSYNPNFAQAALNLNLIVRWEYRLGSNLYFVYSRSQAPALTLQPGQPADIGLHMLRRAPAADVILLKLVHWWG